MSRHEGGRKSSKAVALQYGGSDGAPVIVASGMGYLAEKIVETAQAHGVPIYEDNSLATVLTQLKLGQEIPDELYQAIVEIYVYFLKFDPSGKNEKQENPMQNISQPEEKTTSSEEQTSPEESGGSV